MRIISGSAKGRKLATFSGSAIRPTADRVREALFSILYSRLGSFQEKMVLDLYAGTGALGIEALSRGAARCVFVDQARTSVDLIRRNLEHVALADRAEVRTDRVETLIPRLASDTFDLVFIDPPYADKAIASVIERVAAAGLLRHNGILCLETGAKADLPETVGLLHRFDQRTYGTTLISFYEHADQGELQS